MPEATNRLTGGCMCGAVHHDERVSWFDAAGALPRFHEWEVEEGPYCSDPAV